MNLRSLSVTAASLIAGVVAMSADADAQSVTRSRESAVAVGMSTSEVHKLLGMPERNVQYGNTPGPVWTYKVTDPLFGKTEFNVEFGNDQRVIAAGEIVVGSEAPNSGRD